MKRALKIGVAALTVLVMFTGCRQAADPEPSGSSYTSSDGTMTEFPPDSRGEPIEFSGVTETGGTVTSDDFRGDVLVVNFWYATCPPCRLEAPWLEEMNRKYSPDGVQFLGVNIRDGADTALAFAESFGVTYPSIVDTDGQVALAFSGIASPAAVPTTVVFDRDGRPAARIVGLIGVTTLESMIETVLAETAGGD